MVEKILVFVFGSIVGSFLNVCIHRMPKAESIVWPGSHCPKCSKRIYWYDNIPFISYILLRGRCRFCRQKIPIRYPLVEFLTAAVFVLIFNRFGLSYDFFLYNVFISGLIVATFVDIQHRIIPDEISMGGIVVGLILNAAKGINLSPLTFTASPLKDSIKGIVLGGTIIYLTGYLFDLCYFKILKHPPVEGETSSIGAGDVKLLTMIGAFLGWKIAILTFFIAPFLGAVVGIINILFKKSHIIPYGPFLSLAA
jgi:leader peptidase (prepilin peptidase)/N-methyltransferase